FNRRIIPLRTIRADSLLVQDVLFRGRRPTSQELFCGSLAGLINSVTLQGFPQRSKHDSQIQPEAPMIYVPEIQIKLLFPRKRIPTVHLGPTSDSRFDFVAAGLFWRIAWEIICK